MTAPKTIDNEKPAPGPLRRLARISARLLLTGAVVAGSVVAVGLGAEELSRRADAVPTPEPAAVTPVATVPFEEVSGYDVTRSFIGQVEAKRTTQVSFELSGRLNEILVEEGEMVHAGQHIASLDTRILEADRARLFASRTALEAQLEFSEKTVQRQSKLNTEGFASQAVLDEALSRVDELRARIAEVDAALVTNDLQVEKSKVYAPFSGRIAARLVDGGESVSPGQTLVEVVQDSAPQVRVGLPLDIGEEAVQEVTISVGGRDIKARLATLRPDVDPVTRTRTALFDLPENVASTFGQTARLSLGQHIDQVGLWVPLTTLKEGLRGQWTVLAVDRENVVKALSVQVLHAERDRVFVTGAIPEGARLVADGPQRVTVGQTVAPTTAF